MHFSRYHYLNYYKNKEGQVKEFTLEFQGLLALPVRGLSFKQQKPALDSISEKGIN